MKIVLLCWRDTGHPQGGGSEHYLEQLGHYLKRQGHHVIVRTARYPGAPRAGRLGELTVSRGGGRYTVYPRALLWLMAGKLGLGRARRTELIVDTQNGIPFFARLVGLAPTVVLTHHCHKEQWPVAGPLIGRLGWLIESRLAPYVYRNAPYVTVSEASKKELEHLGVDPARITVIRNGLSPLPQELIRLEPTPQLHLVTLSRLVPHKQIEHAMDALAAVLPRHNAVMDVIGSGWWAEKLHHYAQQLGVADRVIFHGQVGEQVKHALLDQADIHLMPSRKEGWGLAVMEAAQHGVPTIGYRHSAGLCDSVVDGRTGLLASNKTELVAHLERLLTHPEQRRALGRAARRRAAEFSWEDTGAAWEKLLSTLAAARLGHDPGSSAPPRINAPHEG